MKSKLKYLFVFLPVAVAVFACLACGGKNADDNHTHTYATAWTYNDEYHWHAATCEHTGKESDKAVHTLVATGSAAATCTENGYIDYACDCGYTVREETTPAIEHAFFDSVLKYDEQSHWNPAVCEHDDAKINVQSHRYVTANQCSCGYAYEETDASNFEFEEGSATCKLTGLTEEG